MKPSLTLLVGIPASGKSTIAKDIAERELQIVLSSDAIRKELLGDECCQDNNGLVFDTLYKRAKEYLYKGTSVIIDACNINMKDRRRTLSNFEGMDIIRRAIFVACPAIICAERDSERERTVGNDVIRKFLYRFEFPMPFEGFDTVIIANTTAMYDIADIMKRADTFNQYNPHHIHTVGKHCEICADKVAELSQDKNLIKAAKYHDIGKLYTQTYDEDGVAHYYSHHNCSAYILSCSDLHYSGDINGSTIFYVNYHMHPFFWKEQKTHHKYKRLFGEELYNNLLLLHECDKLSAMGY